MRLLERVPVVYKPDPALEGSHEHTELVARLNEQLGYSGEPEVLARYQLSNTSARNPYVAQQLDSGVTTPAGLTPNLFSVGPALLWAPVWLPGCTGSRAGPASAPVFRTPNCFCS
ncbi:MAG: hypothetical protein U0514_00215 [Candidatus Andersenbacteria bacterium]